MSLRPRGPKTDLGTKLRATRPPLVEATVGLFLAQRTLLEAKLEEEVEGVADKRAGLELKVLHHLATVEVGANRIELLLRA